MIITISNINYPAFNGFDEFEIYLSIRPNAIEKLKEILFGTYDKYFNIKEIKEIKSKLKIILDKVDRKKEIALKQNPRTVTVNNVEYDVGLGSLKRNYKESVVSSPREHYMAAVQGTKGERVIPPEIEKGPVTQFDYLAPENLTREQREKINKEQHEQQFDFLYNRGGKNNKKKTHKKKSKRTKRIRNKIRKTKKREKKKKTHRRHHHH